METITLRGDSEEFDAGEILRNRIRTGITGMDNMLEGGIPEGNQIILAGGPGSGKTLMSFEFLYKGAREGQVGVLFSFEEEAVRIIQNAKDAFSEFTDIDDLIKEKKLVVFGSEETKPFIQTGNEQVAYTFSRMISELQNRIEAAGAKRVVIDSISFVKLFISDLFEYRALSLSLLTVLNRQGVTTIITMEVQSQEKNNVNFEQEFFIYDGLVMLYFSGSDMQNRMPTMEIMKMRGTHHSYNGIPYEITSRGINILSMV